MQINKDNMMDYEFFAEKRLVFLRDQEKDKPKDVVSGSKKKMTPKETAEAIRKLHEEVASADFRGASRRSRRRRRTHTEDQITRTMTPVRPSYRESAELAEQAINLEGELDAKETAGMQAANEKLYAQYMNPAFMQYLRNGLEPAKKDIVDKAMRLVVERPSDFSYEPQADKTVHIVKRKPYNKDRKDIDNDFKIVMEPPGNAVEVNGIPLKVDGKVPWMEDSKFNKHAPTYFERWRSEFAIFWRNYKDKPMTEQERQEMKDKAYKSISGPMKDIHMTMHVYFTRRLRALMEARQLKFELEDPQVKDFFHHQDAQGKTYEDITTNGYGRNGGLRLMVVANPKFPGIYEIYTRTFYENPMVVSYEGYIMRPTEDGRGWEPDIRYGEAVRREYYKKHKKGWEHGGLTPEERKRMEEADKQDKKDSEAAKFAEKMERWRKAREDVDQRLYDLCKTRDRAQWERELSILHDVAIAVSYVEGESPQARAKRAANIRTISNSNQVKSGIDEYLDAEFMRIRVPNSNNVIPERPERNEAARRELDRHGVVAR